VGLAVPGRHCSCVVEVLTLQPLGYPMSDGCRTLSGALASLAGGGGLALIPASDRPARKNRSASSASAALGPALRLGAGVRSRLDFR